MRSLRFYTTAKYMHECGINTKQEIVLSLICVMHNSKTLFYSLNQIYITLSPNPATIKLSILKCADVYALVISQNL